LKLASILPWREIDSILLDLDGTLLDLYFDNHFWQVHVPAKYAERHGLTATEAHAECFRRYDAKAGTLDWYCVDYWTAALDLDIAQLKEQLSHLIQVHPDVREFLAAAHLAGKRVALVTNAHRTSLAMKMRQTGLEAYFDAIHSSHSFGIAKEDPAFWTALSQVEPFDPARALLVDDSLPVLRSAAVFGIRHLLAIRQPDSRLPAKDTAEFLAIHRFSEVMPL